MPRKFDLPNPGDVFGKLTVQSVNQAEWGSGDRTTLACLCECGKTCVVYEKKARSGHTKSCGCHRSRRNSLSNSPEFRCWYGMMSRCTKPSNKSFADYGGRGIRVCDRWHDFETFLADMGPKPSDGHSIGRKDNEGNYCPENCRWETRIEQQNNTTRNVFLTLGDITLTMKQWSVKLGIPYPRLQMRIRAGWSTARALCPQKFHN